MANQRRGVRSVGRRKEMNVQQLRMGGIMCLKDGGVVVVVVVWCCCGVVKLCLWSSIDDIESE